MSIRAIKWAHEAVMMTDIGPTERCALHILAYAHNDKTGECFPAMKTIADGCGVCERRARSAVKALADWSLIKVKRGAGPNGNASNRYTLFGKAKRPRETGKRVPVESGTKKPFQIGKRMPVSKRQTCADDRGNTNLPSEGAEKLTVIAGGRA